MEDLWGTRPNVEQSPENRPVKQKPRVAHVAAVAAAGIVVAQTGE